MKNGGIVPIIFDIEQKCFWGIILLLKGYKYYLDKNDFFCLLLKKYKYY